MKILLFIFTLGLLTGCQTYKCAQTDFNNFRKTLELNNRMPACYKHNVF